MRLVNLFTGQKRLILENFKSYKNIQLNNPKKNYNFFVFWDDYLMTGEEKKILNNSLYNFRYKIVNKGKFLKLFKSEFNQIKFDKILKKNDKNYLIAWLHQYYILYEAFKLAKKDLGKKSESYLWQRIRSDNYIPIKINIENVLKDKVSLNFPGAKFGFGLNDFHCIGSFKYFKDYAETIKLMKILLKNSIYLPPEVIISTQLIRKKSLYTINRSLPACLIGSKEGKNYLRSLNSREKGYQYIDFNFSNMNSKSKYLDKSESYIISFLRRFIYSFEDLYKNLIFNFRK